MAIIIWQHIAKMSTAAKVQSPFSREWKVQKATFRLDDDVRIYRTSWWLWINGFHWSNRCDGSNWCCTCAHSVCQATSRTTSRMSRYIQDLLDHWKRTLPNWNTNLHEGLYHFVSTSDTITRCIVVHSMHYFGSDNVVSNNDAYQRRVWSFRLIS